MQLIAKHFNCSYSSINRLIKLFKIKPRTNGKHKKKNITGFKFGKLIAIKEILYTSSKHCQSRWLCQCDCGKLLKIRYSALIDKSRNQCIKCFGLSKIHGSTLSKTLYNRIIKGARYRNLDFKLSIIYLQSLIEQQNFKCKLSGLDIRFNQYATKSHSASLDRIDSSKGYIEGNVQWVHKDINIMKLNHSQDKFIQLCKEVAKYNL